MVEGRYRCKPDNISDMELTCIDSMNQYRICKHFGWTPYDIAAMPSNLLTDFLDIMKEEAKFMDKINKQKS